MPSDTPTPIKPRLMSLRDACTYSGLKLTRMYELLRQGTLTAVKIGRRTLIETSSIDKFIDTLPRK